MLDQKLVVQTTIGDVVTTKKYNLDLVLEQEPPAPVLPVVSITNGETLDISAMSLQGDEITVPESENNGNFEITVETGYYINAINIDGSSITVPEPDSNNKYTVAYDFSSDGSDNNHHHLIIIDIYDVENTSYVCQYSLNFNWADAVHFVPFISTTLKDKLNTSNTSVVSGSDGELNYTGQIVTFDNTYDFDHEPGCIVDIYFEEDDLAQCSDFNITTDSGDIVFNAESLSGGRTKRITGTFNKVNNVPVIPSTITVSFKKNIYIEGEGSSYHNVEIVFE